MKFIEQILKCAPACAALLLAACASGPKADQQSNRVLVVDRETAQLITWFGVERGMTVLDLGPAGGFMTEVLSTAVGPTGKVYAKEERRAKSQHPNVAKADGTLVSVPQSSADFAIAFTNLHDVYHGHPKSAKAGLKSVYDRLKPGGMFGVVDHVGGPVAANARLHRITKQQAIDVLQAVGFVLDAESDAFGNPDDDHNRQSGDASIRGKTDRFILRFRKPA